MSNEEYGYKIFLKIAGLSLMVYLTCHMLIEPDRYTYNEKTRDFVRVGYDN
jgi:hypothetical protein